MADLQSSGVAAGAAIPLRAADVARRLGVSKSAVYELLRRRALRHHRIGRRVRFSEADVDAFLAETAVQVESRPHAYARYPQA